MSYREGDIVLIRATIHRSRSLRTAREDPLNVVFKNGDTFPLRCVEVACVEHYEIRPGDRIRIPEQGASPRQGVVKAVVKDVPTPQIAYVIEGLSKLYLMDLSAAKRIGPEAPPKVKEGGN